MFELFECVNVWFYFSSDLWPLLKVIAPPKNMHNSNYSYSSFVILIKPQSEIVPKKWNGQKYETKNVLPKKHTNIYFSSISNYPHVTKYHRYSQACSFLVQIIWSWSKTRSQNLDTGGPRPHSVICLGFYLVSAWHLERR